MSVSQTDEPDQLARFGHDFIDLLTAIIGYTDLSLRRVGIDDPIRHNLEETKKAAERAACLVHQLRTITRPVNKPAVAIINSSSESHRS